MKKLAIVLLTSCIVWSNASAQVMEEDVYDHKLMFNDLYSIKEYKNALPHLKWLSISAPDVDENVHIKGVRVIDALIKKSSSDEEKFELQEFALDLYEQRIEYFGSNATVKSLQLTAYYKYYVKRKDKYSDLLSVFEKNISENISLMSNANFLAYFDILRRISKTDIEIDEKLVLNNYGMINNLMIQRDKQDGYDKRIESFLSEVVTLDCQKIQDVYGVNVKDDLDALGSSKMFVNLSLKNDCTESEVFEQALNYMAKYEPTSKILLYLAKRAMKKNELGEAEMYFGKALGLANDSDTESDIYLNLAKIYTVRNQKPKASEFAFKSIKANNNKQAYTLIGNLYMASFDECVGEKDLVERRSVFIAAYDMFEKASDTTNMAIAKANFPSMQEIHMNNYALGDEMTVSCWFSHTVSLQKRNE